MKNRIVKVEKPRHPKGWWLDGTAIDDYECSIDKSVFHSGTQSAYIKSIRSGTGFFSLSQSIGPAEYLEKRLCMSVWIKTLDVKGWAAPWIRVDERDCKALSFDNRCQSLIVDTTDWTKYELVVDVPSESLYVAFGAMLGGEGHIWIDDFQFAVVGNDVPTTDCPCSAKHLENGCNLNFEFSSDSRLLPPWV